MQCIPGLCGADEDRGAWPERGVQDAPAQEVRNRQEAALFLRAAAMTDDAVARELLRRRAAQLIAPAAGGPGRPPRPSEPHGGGTTRAS